MADFFEMIGMIQREYPNIFALLNKPGVLQVALDIVQHEIDHTPYTTDQINAALEATPYYQSTPKSGREFDISVALDPATAQQTIDNRAADMEAWAGQMGLQLTHDEAMFAAASGLSRGYTTPQEWQRDLLTNFYAQTATSQMPIAKQLQDAAAQYGVPISPMTGLDWSRQVMMGDASLDSFNAYLREQAKSLYPALSAAIDSGITVRQYADPYAQIASKELGINPADFNLSDPKWSAPLNQIDPKTGERTAMTLSSWQSYIRSNDQYGYDTSTGARDQAAQFATSLAQEFGAMG